MVSPYAPSAMCDYYSWLSTRVDWDVPSRLLKRTSGCAYGVFPEMTDIHEQQKGKDQFWLWMAPSSKLVVQMMNERSRKSVCIWKTSCCFSRCVFCSCHPLWPSNSIFFRLQCELTPVTLQGVSRPSVSHWQCILGPSCSAASSSLDWAATGSSGSPACQWSLWTILPLIQ